MIQFFYDDALPVPAMVIDCGDGDIAIVSNWALCLDQGLAEGPDLHNALLAELVLPRQAVLRAI